MSRNTIATILAVILAITSVFTAWSAVRYYFSRKQWEKEQPTLQIQNAYLNQTRNVIRALLNDTLEYSKRHPEIRPLLERYLLKGRTNAPAATTNTSASPSIAPATPAPQPAQN